MAVQAAGRENPMHLVIARVVVSPEHAEETAAALLELTHASRQDDGCLAYDFTESLETPGDFRSIEEWVSQEALASHLEQPHVAAAVEQLTPLLLEEIEVVGHDVADA